MSQTVKAKKPPRAKVIQRSLLRSQQKERQKVAEEILKLQRLKSGDDDPHVQQLYRSCESLERAFNAMAGEINQNFRTYQRVQMQLDARVGAIFRVLEDLITNSPGLIDSLRYTSQVLGGPKTPGWEAYMQEQLAAVQEEVAKYAEIQAAAAKYAAEKSAEASADPLTTPVFAPQAVDDDSPIEFGGDHAENQ